MGEDNILFDEFIRNHLGILYKVARTYNKNNDDVEDLVQEIMVQIWKSLPKYNPDYKISTWLYKIALNTAISNFRRKGKPKEIYFNETFEEIDNEEQNKKEEQLQQLEKFISELNEIDKALILLYLEEKSQVEISDILGISTTNVSTKIGRIKEKLKIKFENLK